MTSELEQRNINIMIAEAQRMHDEVEQLRADYNDLRADFMVLQQTLLQYKEDLVMAMVKIQMAESGHGGTA